MEDKILLLRYLSGFNDELDGSADKKSGTKMFNLILSPIEKRAYNMGRNHAKLGDDNPNLDYISDEDILKIIKA